MTNLRNGLKAGGMALALVLGAGSANATDFAFGAIAPGTMKSQVSGHSPGSFSDNFTFSISTAGPDGSYSYFNFLTIFRGQTLSNITNAVLNLTGPTTTTTSLVDGEHQIALASGNYNANVTGSAVGAGGGAYEFNITAPTPEPAVWLTMLFGAGVIGMGVRRRRSGIKPNSFAMA